jgi:hypothetical protein
MNNFLNDMQSLTLYKEITKSKPKSKSKTILDDTPDDIKLEMVKYKKAISATSVASKVDTVSFGDYSSISELSGQNSINAMTSIKDNIASSGAFGKAPTGANSVGANIQSGGVSSGGGAASSLAGYSSSFGGSFGGGSIPSITQFGLVKMTGTEGKLQNGYTIGKDAKSRASASLDYITRDENGKSIAEIKDKDGNRLSKQEAKDLIKDIQAERRLVLSPNPRLNLSEQQLDKIVRATMSSYSESFGKEFEYMYAIHNNTATPHAHIIMTTKHPDGDGIKMYKDELFELKMNFEDAVKEEVENSNIKIKDNITLPMARQIGNFIGAIPDTNMFNQNKYLAYKISQKFDLDYEQKVVGDDPQKLEEWFGKNQSSYKEYFMSAQNKEAFLFQEYSKSAQELSYKYDLGLTEKTTTNIKEFKNWVDDKKEIFLAERIAQDKNIILQKDDVQDSKKLYKWFMENESEIKQWNEEYKNHPSKQMGSLASKYGDMVDNRPDNLMTDRKVAREFVKNYTRDPLQYAGESRTSLYYILDSRQQQFKNELKEERITQKTFDTETKRLESLQSRLLKGQEVNNGSLQRYNIDTSIFAKDLKTIELDGIDLKEQNSDIRKDVISKINTHKENLDQDLKDKKIDEEYHKTYTKKANALSYIVSKEKNISVSSLENIGLNKEADLKDFKIEKVKTELEILNFKDTDIQKSYVDIIVAECDNKKSPLKHQLQKIATLENKLGIKADQFTLSDYKEANKFIDSQKEISQVPENINNIETNMTQETYTKVFDEFLVQAQSSVDFLESNKNDFYTLMSFAIEDKNIEMMDKLFATDTTYSNDKDLLELKFEAYADALDINKDEVYGKLLEKYFNFTNEELEKIDNYEKVFDTYLEFSSVSKENDFMDISDIKNQFFTEALVEQIIEKYDEFQWEAFDMEKENNSEENIKGYFDAIEQLNKEGIVLNDFVAKEMDIKALESEIEHSLNRGNFTLAQELMNDERLDEFTRNSFEYIYQNILGSEDILDEVYENILDNVQLDEKVYEIFKEEDFLNDMKKIDLQEEMLNEIEEELQQEEIEEHERTLGGE